MASGMNPELAQAIIASSKRLGIDPVDLATTISYESEGTFSPSIWGGKNRNYLGLIQFGPEERAKYGVNPSQSAVAQMGAVENFLRDRGVRPGMGLLDVYSTINAGAPGLYNRSDAANGGMPGTVRDKVEHQMGAHRTAAMRLLGMSGAGMLPTSSSLPAANATTPAFSATPAATTAPTDTGDANFLASLQAIPKLIAQQQPTMAPAPPVADNSGMRAKLLAAVIAAASKQQEGSIA